MFVFENARLAHQGPAVFERLSLRIDDGEQVALLGPSGAGKSTLLAALRRQQPGLCAWCPQQGALVPMLSVFHNIYMGSLARHSRWTNLRNLIHPSRAQRHAVGLVAEQLGLTDKLFTSIDQLSGGQAQRTALGRAIYCQRPVLLADEPVSNVDEHQALALTRQVLDQHPTAVIAMHDRALALQCCQRLIGIREGRIVLDARAAELTLGDLDALYQ
ncbi:ABC transporter ATP-binding protein [Alcanivorax hongdengensis A-11-3]|uniref:ABC transporter ATP-binding protein n=1 Tax=Alcanivorax hongdengensis A-11-3 TaxID=1177179 RepID=L0WHG4_9GAMM|nr:ATP-binding cassette domain-containing protein [Alcanivorax hongdengensis]EKF75582.1 ABC transporter ATP-binding protein [Alcanivorax hongdengensis A-11-3]